MEFAQTLIVERKDARLRSIWCTEDMHRKGLDVERIPNKPLGVQFVQKGLSKEWRG
jgi:hypothetical protein